MCDTFSGEPCGELCSFNRSCDKMQTDDIFDDKENLKCEDISLYESNSPLVQSASSLSHCPHNRLTRRPLYDHEHDCNSQDSGYNGESGKFSSYSSPLRGSSQSFGSSLFSMEDEFLEDFSDVEPLDKNNLPQDFNKLINEPLINRIKPVHENKISPKNDNLIRPVFRRSLSLQNEKVTPQSSRVRSCLFKADNENRNSFKRPEPPSDDSFTIKRSRIFDNDDENVPSVPDARESRPLLSRTVSATEESIMCAVQRSSTEPDLIGDFSKNYSLPLVKGRHPDLKSITPATLAMLMRGEFRNTIASFKVIDCRYPYEFDGGHIEGAINIYTKEQCLELLQESQVPRNDDKRHILVFHCEFSSERGPNLYRYLRKEDRYKNIYPSLNYPEMYLLEGGYKNFFGEYPSMCVPIAYKEMLHPDHEQEMRLFRQKSKTWNVDSRQRPVLNRNLKRLL